LSLGSIAIGLALRFSVSSLSGILGTTSVCFVPGDSSRCHFCSTATGSGTSLDLFDSFLLFASSPSASYARMYHVSVQAVTRAARAINNTRLCPGGTNPIPCFYSTCLVGFDLDAFEGASRRIRSESIPPDQQLHV
jgi:hypothetical protein